ncbi:MAG TPA: hypothetical protein QGH10_11955 [Armatimonadota bacterium]|nr:hypothetical protein [Armatimonadota bacterium]
MGAHVRIPYFELGEDGGSQVYLRLQQDDLGVVVRPLAGLLHGYLYEGGDTLSYHGAHVTDDRYDPDHEEPSPPYAAGIDIVSEALASIAPDRFAVELKRPQYDAQVGPTVAKAYGDFIGAQISPMFRAVSLAATRAVGGWPVGDDADLGEVWWAVRSENEGAPELRWEKLCGEFVKPPRRIVLPQGAGDWPRLRTVISGVGESYRVLGALRLLHQGFAMGHALTLRDVRVTRFLAARGIPGVTHAVPLPLVTPAGRPDEMPRGASAPEEWAAVAVIGAVQVADHPLTRAFGIVPAETGHINPEELLRDPEGLARAIISGWFVPYNQVASRADSELRRTWGLLERACGEGLPYIANWSVHGLDIYTRTGAKRIAHEGAEYGEYLPWPDDPKWTADLEFWAKDIELPWSDGR